MMKTLIDLQVRVIGLHDRAQAKLTGEADRGSETIDKVIWGGVTIALATGVAAAVRAYVTSKTGEIQ